MSVLVGCVVVGLSLSERLASCTGLYDDCSERKF